MASETVRPNDYIFARLPSKQLRLIKVIPNTTLTISKLGSFPANELIHRPYHLTYDIIEGAEKALRLVPKEEVTRDFLGQEDEAETETPEGEAEDIEEAEASSGKERDQVDAVLNAWDVETSGKTNRDTIDTSTSQKLTFQEIEALKSSSGATAGRDIIDAIMQSHTELHKKTSFSLHKYTVRKRAKYLKRFTVLPVDISGMLEYAIEEKEPQKVLELRNEQIGLMMSLANIHYGGRYLVVDETGGLLVGAIAERLGVLHQPTEEPKPAEEPVPVGPSNPDARPRKRRRPPFEYAQNNTINLLHAHEQPNLALLKYFGYDVANENSSHPLNTHLKPLTYLQLLHPELEPTLTEVPTIPDSELSSLKSNKRTAYLKKRRRFAKLKACVEDTQAGGFDALIIAAENFQDYEWYCNNLIPLVRGSGQVVIFSPYREALAPLVEKYSSLRRSNWVKARAADPSKEVTEEERPDPTLLLAPTLHSTVVRHFQVLPGRTHPKMTSRGGAEGYVFHAIRVIPAEGRVFGKGTFEKRKKRKVETESSELEQDEETKKVQEEIKKTMEKGDDVKGALEGDKLTEWNQENMEVDMKTF